jgi:phosphotransferase system  glucose/maltose/N-acetylglucosamine-specific IIC component
MIITPNVGLFVYVVGVLGTFCVLAYAGFRAIRLRRLRRVFTPTMKALLVCGLLIAFLSVIGLIAILMTVVLAVALRAVRRSRATAS